MHIRLDAGTDIGMIGAWDGDRSASPFSKRRARELDQVVKADASEGHLFVVYTGADGGGPLDIFVDQELPDDIREQVTPVGGEFLLRLPTGRLVVDGVECYRSTGKMPDTSSRASITPGDYALRCHVGKDEDKHPPTQKELNRRVGAENVRYYDRINRVGLLTIVLLNLGLLGAFTFWLGWKIALGVAVVTFIVSTHVQEYILKRNQKYHDLDRIIPKLRVETQRPTFVFELRSITNPTGLRGGFVRL